MNLSAMLVDLIVISLFFIIGAILRTKVDIFQRFIIPASVIGGIIGLVMGKNVLDLVPISDFYPQLANVGIDVVFAGVALGTTPNPLVPQTTGGLDVTKRGTVVADEEVGKTSKPGVWAGGDVVTGAATVISAMGAGKRAAASIDEALKG